MQNQCLFFYQHKQWIQITAISHQNAYQEVFWLKFQGGACPQTPQTVLAANCAPRTYCAQRANCAPRANCALHWNWTTKYLDAFSFFWGKPWIYIPTCLGHPKKCPCFWFHGVSLASFTAIFTNAVGNRKQTYFWGWPYYKIYYIE